MDRILYGVLALVALVLAGFLVPLLVQLRRTARAVERLAESAREDFRTIALDVHQTRLQLDRLGELAEQSLRVPANLGAAASSILRSLTSSIAGDRSSLLEIILALVKMALDFFRRPSSPAPEKTHE